MAAVLEGALENVPAIGFSLNDYSHQADFSKCEPYILAITRNVLEKGIPEFTCLNVNIPSVNGSPIKGIKIMRQARAFWEENFDQRQDPHDAIIFGLPAFFAIMIKVKIPMSGLSVIIMWRWFRFILILHPTKPYLCSKIGKPVSYSF